MAHRLQIFWDVDTQVDFLSPGGKLYVPGSEAIVPRLRRLTQWAGEHRVLVVASADAHEGNDAEFQQWPPHCVAGTAGQQKIPETTLPRQLVLPNRRVAIPADLSAWQQVVLEKQQLDVFTNPNTEPLVEQLGRPDVVLYGVVTEICVVRAARNLLRQGCRVTLVEDAMAALDAAKARSCLEELIGLGARLAKAGEIVEA
ncbi:MAG: isochorismatase family cysteine hydrolase [Acidobacteriaceae bacterium]|jgi:nicotinamidase/pyrazinamidase